MASTTETPKEQDASVEGTSRRRSVSRNGKPIGRPVTRVESLKTVSTRCPGQVYKYMKAIMPYQYKSLTGMFNDMMARFMDTRPWDHGLYFRRPKTSITTSGGRQGATGWEQINIQLEPDIFDRVTNTAKTCGVSRAAFVYTAMFWWCQYVFPPPKVQAPRIQAPR